MSTPAKSLKATDKRLPIIAGAVIVTLAFLGLVFATVQRPAPYVPEVIGSPNAELSTTSIDHGDVQMEQTVESLFTITNTGDQTLRIFGEPRVELVRGCCPPRAIVSQMTLNPGEQATISLRYTMHEMMGGPHEFRVHVTTNDPNQPTIYLTSLSNWIE